jgi:hypothetical protein
MSDRRDGFSFPRAFVALATCALFAAVFGSVGSAAGGGKPYTVCAKGCQYTAIQPAVDAAADGATITVGPGVYAGGVTIEKDLTLVGANAKRTVIAGNASTNVVEAVSGDITLRGLTIAGGDVGVAVSFFPRVTVADSIVVGNRWGTGGFGGSVAVQRSIVTRNADAGVGPIFSGGATVDDSTVSQNGVGVLGDSRMLVVVRNSRILANRNSGIVMPGGDLEVYGSTIRGNTGVDGGGIALYVGRAGSTAKVVDTTIRHNTASAYGGGIFIDILSRLTRERSKVFRNSALKGGGIYNGGEWQTEQNFFSIDSRIWNNTPDDYLEDCDPLRRSCSP